MFEFMNMMAFGRKFKCAEDKDWVMLYPLRDGWCLAAKADAKSGDPVHVVKEADRPKTEEKTDDGQAGERNPGEG